MGALLYLPGLLNYFNSALKKLPFIALLCVLFPAQLSAKELVVAFGKGRAPYVMDNASSGIEVDIFKAALAYKNHTLRAITVSNKRAEIILRTFDKVDAVATVNTLADDDFYSVSKFIFFENYAISKKKNNLTIEHISDLADLTIISWQGFSNTYKNFISDTNSANELSSRQQSILELAIQERQNELFWLNRADIAIN